MMAHAHTLLGDYVWQQDAFALRASCLDGRWGVGGTTCFGDNVEDEWLVVFVLFSVSRAWPQAVVSVSDDDGQFLLIEGADHVPEWLTPESSDGRVVIYGGAMHLIPYPRTPADLGLLPTGVPSAAQVRAALNMGPAVTAAPAALQAAIESRLAIYPAYIRASQHFVTCFVPERAAQLLHARPSLVAHAVRAFVERDPLDMKYCKTMALFPPASAVPARVHMTRLLYAQLMHQRFHPGKAFGTAPPPDAPEHRAFTLGAKLACGFEILASRTPRRPANSDGPAVSPDDPLWQQYVQRLSALGYFQVWRKKQKDGVC